jgi:hypothetical protein
LFVEGGLPHGLADLDLAHRDHNRGFSCRDRRWHVAGVTRSDCPPVGQDLAHVVEDDHAVAQQAPPLLGVGGEGVSGVAVGTVS